MKQIERPEPTSNKIPEAYVENCPDVTAFLHGDAIKMTKKEFRNLEHAQEFAREYSDTHSSTEACMHKGQPGVKIVKMDAVTESERRAYVKDMEEIKALSPYLNGDPAMIENTTSENEVTPGSSPGTGTVNMPARKMEVSDVNADKIEETLVPF